jgi:phosphatidylserine/phosphatidylglycerophosphate/cardiolipin synthase-like enzyme
MAGIVPLVAPAGVTRVGEARVSLPDPQRTAGEPIARSGVARHPGATVVFLELESASGVDVFAPATSAVRIVDGVSLGTLTSIVELSPLPFASDARALFAELGAVPTFYLGIPTGTLADDDLVEIEEVLHTTTAGESIWIGAVFPDGVTRIPSAWIERIATALSVVDPPNEWSSLLTLFGNERRLMILDHAGFPAEETQFEIRLSGDTAAGWVRVLPPGAFDLEQVVASDPLDGVASLFTPPPGRQFEVRALLGEGAKPLQSLLDGNVSSFEDAFLPIPPSSGAARFHLQITDVGSWYPDFSAPSTVERYRTGSRLEPLVDGTPTFKLLTSDLAKAAHPDHGAQLTGWAFNRFILDNEDGKDLVQIAETILGGGGKVCVLATRFLQDEQNFELASLQVKAITLLLASIGLGTPLFLLLQKENTEVRAFVLAQFIAVGAPIALGMLLGNVREIATFMEPSGELMNALNALTSGGPIAIHSRNPVRLRDNPIGSSNLPFDIDVLTDHFGVWHNKMQLVKFRDESNQTSFSAYIGGVDINANRVDTPSHNSPHMYHDVHSRVTGPAVRDAWISFNERWDFDRRNTAAAMPIPPPTVAELPVSSAGHIVRIGRTYFGPNPDGSSNPLDFAPEGERSIFDTVVAAIGRARRYIYIEEQYFASHGSTKQPDPSEGTFHGELLRAASNCDRLVILVPSAPDQPWGEARRRAIFAELREAWGPRLYLGFPMRRPTLGNGPLITGTGRTRLLEDIDASQARFRIGPDVRVPKSPFWMWIDGELMIIHTTQRVEFEGAPATQVDVLRALTPQDQRRWLATPRPHKKGAPVTHSRLGSIYVHAKTIMVDDIFVSIGSANINRRGFFWDGEINAFAIPERLAAAPDNPARALRSALWAEHLGMPPAMGEVLLADAVASSDYFLRSPWLGNRFTPFDTVDLKGQFALTNNLIKDSTEVITMMLKLAGLLTIEGQRDLIWNRLSDPTSFTDPHPTVEEL